MFERADWTLFRNLNTISQKAGVPLHKLRRLVMKEMVDNALDAVAGEKVEFGKIGDNTYWVRDEGPGINLPVEKLAALFSINRPLTSSKILRLPSRGALGNGLRVIVGSAMASSGFILLETRNKRYEFEFNDATGMSTILKVEESKVTGTKLTVMLGDAVPKDEHDLYWAKLANGFHMATVYKGKSSPWWYDSDSFYELLLAAGEMYVPHLVTQFDGVKEVGPLVIGFPGECRKMSRSQADELMTRLRGKCKEVNPKHIGNLNFTANTYGVLAINPGRGAHDARLPYCVEAYAVPINDNPEDDKNSEDEAKFFVNATPITGLVSAERQQGNKLAFFGCGLKHFVKASRRKSAVWVNVTIPYMPITTDGKEPNFLPLLEDLSKVIDKATRKFKSRIKKDVGGQGQRDIILEHLQEGIANASGDGVYRYSLRQLFYSIRPYILQQGENQELNYNYFGRVITEYESNHGELPGIYRDPRGTLYHPHEGLSIPIGTLAVEEYKRPAWTFNKILYCEKEGFFSVLQQVKWPERNDCALLSSKGFASRAVRDVLDLMGETDEQILFFCIHDADASGTLIYQSLTEATLAREARKVKIINLGLDPWEAVEDELQTENFTAKRTLPVARYVKDFDTENGTRWRGWLQSQRVELNAMTSPMFLAWLDRKMAEYDNGKVIPSDKVMREKLMSKAEETVRQVITERILIEQRVDDKVKSRMDEVTPTLDAIKLGPKVRARLQKNSEHRWDIPVCAIAEEVVK